MTKLHALAVDSTMTADPRVLVVCGGAEERLMIHDLFAREGFDSQSVATAAEAESALDLGGADLIILDGRFGDGGAMAVCRRLAVTSTVPIIMISEHADVTERVIALEVGADDVLSQPFNSRELLARARALVRRSRALRDVAAARVRPDHTASDRIVEAAEAGGPVNWSLDLMTRELTGPTGQMTKMTAGELSFLHVFLSRPGQPVTAETTIVTGAPVTLSVFRTSVVRLRRKMEMAGFRKPVIKTLRGGGYYIDKEAAAGFSFEQPHHPDTPSMSGSESTAPSHRRA